MRILYVNDAPVPHTLKVEFKEGAGIDLDIAKDLVIARHIKDAEKLLPEAETFDLVLMDYEMYGQNTVDTGLVQKFVERGFGVGKKMLIANSRAWNKKLMRAGCSHECSPNDFKKFAREHFSEGDISGTETKEA